MLIFCTLKANMVAFYSHCHVRWCPLMTGIVTSQCPSSRDAERVIRYLGSFVSGWSQSTIIILPQSNMFSVNLRTALKVMLLILTSMGHRISLKRCQWLAWQIQCAALAFVTQECTWLRASIASPIENFMPFPFKIHKAISWYKVSLGYFCILSSALTIGHLWACFNLLGSQISKQLLGNVYDTASVSKNKDP